MAHTIPSIPTDLFGMSALGSYRPDVYANLAALADTVLYKRHPDSTLAPSDREAIATYVSSLNDCAFCTTSHGAAAASHLRQETGQSAGDSEAAIDSICIKHDHQGAGPKLSCLLRIAAQVREGGKNVTESAVAEAKNCGATDMDVHDTVLIASMFCMLNRYVDGMVRKMPEDTTGFKQGGEMIATMGYVAGGQARGILPKPSN